MLEVVIIFIIVVVIFAGVMWYAMQRTRQRNSDILDELSTRIEPELSDSAEFGAVLKQEMTQHIIDSNTNVDNEPTVSLSPQAMQEQLEPQSQQAEINLTLDDDVDISTALATSGEPEKEKQAQTQTIFETANDWDMVVAFTVMAEKGHSFAGDDLKLVLESEFFHYGELQIFHRMATRNI